MSTKSSSLAKILQKYKSGWVSVTKDHNRMIAWGKNLDSLLQKIEQKGNPDGVIIKAAKDYSSYVGIQ